MNDFDISYSCKVWLVSELGYFKSSYFLRDANRNKYIMNVCKERITICQKWGVKLLALQTPTVLNGLKHEEEKK